MAKRRKKSRYKALKLTFTILICIFLLVSMATIGIGAAIIKNSPPLDVNRVLNLNEPSILYDDKGNFMDVVATTEQRTVISFNTMPDNLKNAFVSIEDERFYKHTGIDIKRLTSVIFIDIKNKLTNKSGIQGASTITQQLVRNIYLSSQVSFKRKLQEIYLSLKLEKLLTKDQILGAYMNTIFLGGRAFGVESAAQQYFGKSANSLNLIECAFIAGIPQSPSVYNPYSSAAKKNPSIYLNRTKNVLKKMYDNNYISEKQYLDGINDISSGKLNIKPYTPKSNKLENEWFSMPAIDAVKKDLKVKYQYTDSQVNQLLTYGGLKIYTSMDKNLQEQTQETLNNDSALGSSSDKNGIIQPQASAVVMNYHTGEVKALIGGRGTQPAMSYNRASSVNYLRPPGSCIKPLTVYSPAIDLKKATAATTIEDSPLSDDLAQKYSSNGTPYNPKDDEEMTNGDMTLRNALMKSINVIAVKLEDTLGLETGASYADKFGISLDTDDRSSIAALSLGELHNGTNTLQMAAAYGVFGNNGMYTAPRLYTKVTNRNGKVILESKVDTKKVISPATAYIMYDMLKGPVSKDGTGPSANFSSMVRGKTGTSSDKKNLWFSGLTPYYSASIWIGNDDNSSINSLNSNSAAAIWADVMRPFHDGLPAKDISMPSGLVISKVCSESGYLPSPLCYIDPTGSKVYDELFLTGTIPTNECNLGHTWFSSNPLSTNKNKSKKTYGNQNESNNINNENEQNNNPAFTIPNNTDSNSSTKQQDNSSNDNKDANTTDKKSDDNLNSTK